jgi:hypothetical protein
MNALKLLFYSIALSLAMAGIIMMVVKSLDKKRFSVASLLCLTALVAAALVAYLAGIQWSPR